jgi:hypothetical protein
MTYINKTIEKRSLPDYFMSAITGIIGGILSGFVIARILIRRQKPEIIYTRKLRTNRAMQLSSLSKGKIAYTFDMTRKLRTNRAMQLSSLSKGKLAYTFDMMKNVEPPEELRDRMMDVRRLQSQDSEAETATGDSGEDRR